MIRQIFIVTMLFAMVLVALPWGSGQVWAQPDAAVEKNDAARADRLRERAERVQKRMKERAAYEKWKNAKARDKAVRARAARAKAAPVKAAPVKDGKGDAQ